MRCIGYTVTALLYRISGNFSSFGHGCGSGRIA